MGGGDAIGPRAMKRHGQLMCVEVRCEPLGQQGALTLGSFVVGIEAKSSSNHLDMEDQDSLDR